MPCLFIVFIILIVLLSAHYSAILGEFKVIKYELFFDFKVEMESAVLR